MQNTVCLSCRVSLSLVGIGFQEGLGQFLGPLCASTRGRSFSSCIGMLAKLQKSPLLVFLNDHRAQIDHRALLNGQVRMMKALDGVGVEGHSAEVASLLAPVFEPC